MQTLFLNSTGLSAELTTVERVQITGASVPDVSIAGLISASRLEVFQNPLLQGLSVPQLRSHVGSTNEQVVVTNNPLLTNINLNELRSSTWSIGITSNASLTTLQLDKLVFVSAYLSIVTNSALVSLSLPALVSVATFPFLGLQVFDNVNLANVTLSKYLPTNGRPQSFQNCALTGVSVDHILARCVASTNYVSGTVNLSGGTNAVPGAQGQLDKAALIARGCTVITN